MGGLCDLLWADPVNNTTGEIPQSWLNNDVRGCSYIFGKDAINTFLRKNNLTCVLRAHEAEYEGFKTFLWG